MVSGTAITIGPARNGPLPRTSTVSPLAALCTASAKVLKLRAAKADFLSSTNGSASGWKAGGAAGGIVADAVSAVVIGVLVVVKRRRSAAVRWVVLVASARARAARTQRSAVARALRRLAILDFEF